MIRILMPAIAVLALGACQHGPNPVDAVIADDTPETMAALKAGLGQAMGRTYIELGATDPTQRPMVSVLPLPLSPADDRSLERPTLFDLVLEDGVCLAINRETAQETPLPGVPCRPV
ncbi:MAG: hypothetical protein AAFY82_08595 [Pseudomonadota bacterium]